MSLNQIIDKDYSAPLVVDETLHLKANTLRLKSNLDVETINDQPYPPSSGLPSPLVANKILRTNALADDVYWGDVPHGSANQVLVTNPTGTGALWSNSLDLSGNISADGSLSIGSNASFGQSVDVTDALTSKTLTVTTNANVYGNISALVVNANQGNISDLTTDAITNATVIYSDSVYVNGSATFNGSSTMNITSIAGLTTTAQTNVKNLNLTDYKLKLNNVSGSVGQILQYDASGNLAFASPASSNLQIVKQSTVLTNVNTSTNLFAGSSTTNYGVPKTNYNIVTNYITVNAVGLVNISGQISLSTRNAQGKLVIRNTSTLAAIYIKSLDYVPSLTTEQILDFAFTYNFTSIGATYEVLMIPNGAGGVIDLLGDDPTYGLPTCVMYIQNQ